MAGWDMVAGDDAMVLERELRREFSPAHVRRDRVVVAVARRDDCDEVVFRLDDGRLCVVHLTWSVATNPRFPSCEFVSEIPDDP